MIFKSLSKLACYSDTTKSSPAVSFWDSPVDSQDSICPLFVISGKVKHKLHAASTWKGARLAKCRTATTRYIHDILSTTSQVVSNAASRSRGDQKRRHLKNALPKGTATKSWNERPLCLLPVYVHICHLSVWIPSPLSYLRLELIWYTYNSYPFPLQFVVYHRLSTPLPSKFRSR